MPAFELAPFLKWVATNGFKGRGLSFATGDYAWERGLIAESNVPLEEAVLVVPRRVAITDDPTLLEPSPTATLNWGAVMALRLLQERARGDDSMWALYLPSLPTEIPALWWLAATQSPLLHEVHYPMAVTQATLMATDVRNTYHTLGADVLAGASVEEWLWAVAVVHSRSFGVEQRGTLRHLLLPLADMLNHGGDELRDGRTECTTNVEWVTEAATDAIYFVATQPIARGMEALLSYGDRTNDHFVLYYGFTPKNNPHDDVVLFDDLDALIQWYRLQLSEDGGGVGEAAWEQRVQVARAAVAATEKAITDAGDGEIVAAEPRLKVQVGSKLDARLVAALVALAAGEGAGELSASHIQQAYVLVRMRCTQLLRAMPTTLQHDLALLLCDTSEGAADGQAHWRELWRQLGASEGWGATPPEAALPPAAAAAAVTSYEHRMLVAFRAYKKLLLTRALRELRG